MTTTHPPNQKLSAVLENAPVVELTDREYRIAEHIAAARALSYKHTTVGETFGDLDDIEAHITGVIGEMTVCKIARAELDDKIYVRGDPGHDLCLAGKRADVKATATNMSLPELLVPADQHPDADLYILAHRIDEQRVRLLGWVGHDTLTDREPERHPTPDSKRNYVVRPHELRPIPVE